VAIWRLAQKGDFCRGVRVTKRNQARESQQADSAVFTDETLRSEILRLLRCRRPALSICPSEIARSLVDDEHWRPLMPRIRSVLVDLIRERSVIVTRGARVLGEQELAVGTIRIRRGPKFD
jgi:hypothetical protein